MHHLFENRLNDKRSAFTSTNRFTPHATGCFLKGEGQLNLMSQTQCPVSIIAEIRFVAPRKP